MTSPRESTQGHDAVRAAPSSAARKGGFAWVRCLLRQFQVFQIAETAIPAIEIDGTADTGHAAAIAVLPEAPGTPGSRDVGRGVADIGRQPQRAVEIVVRVADTIHPEVIAGVDDSRPAGQCLDAGDEGLNPVPDLRRRFAVGRLDVKSQLQVAANRLDRVIKEVGLSGGIAAGMAVVIGPADDTGRLHVGPVVGEVRIGVGGPFGRFLETEGTAGAFDAAPVDISLVAGAIDALDGVTAPRRLE